MKGTAKIAGTWGTARKIPEAWRKATGILSLFYSKIVSIQKPGPSGVHSPILALLLARVPSASSGQAARAEYLANARGDAGWERRPKNPNAPPPSEGVQRT